MRINSCRVIIKVMINNLFVIIIIAKFLLPPIRAAEIVEYAYKL